ncbi:unnamed protein product [Rotaria sordida]|uniref:Uncharacterized protein n=1 Tax=Rotaria sordida TaxID=392033 RepID=A0A814RZ83_9BILA|nr:unnamed protein product [Rotaria sordida]CAF1371053.1 unnamed protein product [Rotaria sordida]
MNTKLQQPIKKKTGQVVPLLNSLTGKLNVPHRFLSSVPRVKVVSRRKLPKTLEIPISNIPTIRQYSNKLRETRYDNSFESSKTKTSRDSSLKSSRIKTNHDSSFEPSKIGTSHVITTKNNERYQTSFKVLCFGTCDDAFRESSLPTNDFSGVTVFPFWDDLYIYSSTSQGIYYGTEGNAPNRTLIFEYYMSHYQQPSQYYQFQLKFFEATSGIVQFKYFYASDGGVTATVGVQKSSSGPYIQHSYHETNAVQSNMILTFNTNLGTYTNSAIG